MSAAEQIAATMAKFDELSERYLALLERKLQADVIAQGGPHDDEYADLPPDPTSAWQRVTVEEAILHERLRLQAERRELEARWRTHLGIAA